MTSNRKSPATLPCRWDCKKKTKTHSKFKIRSSLMLVNIMGGENG